MNTDRDISFGGGLHVGEFAEMETYLGGRWVERFVSKPMLGVEYVAGRVDGMLEYYKLLQETTWALIEEAFSDKVIEVGVTSTEVRQHQYYPYHLSTIHQDSRTRLRT